MKMSPPDAPRRKSSAVAERRRVLAQWRGIDLVPLETAARNHSQPIGQFVNKLVGDLRLDRRRAEAEIVKVWNHLMDPNIAAHAQPVGLTKGTLFVTVDSSVWLDEIVRYRRKEILDRLQHSFGKETILKISFRVG
jgi:predicted nucleic acid-binding Zn ribbon protein